MPDKTCGRGKYQTESPDEDGSPVFKLTKAGLRVNRLQEAMKREDNGQCLEQKAVKILFRACSTCHLLLLGGSGSSQAAEKLAG